MDNTVPRSMAGMGGLGSPSLVPVSPMGNVSTATTGHGVASGGWYRSHLNNRLSVSRLKPSPRHAWVV